MVPTSGMSVAIVMFLLSLNARAFKHSDQCEFLGYKPGGNVPELKDISLTPPEKFETSTLDQVFDYFNKGGTATASILAVIDSAGVALKGSPQVTAALGIMAFGIGIASNSPSPNDVLDKAYKSVELLAEEVNVRMRQMQDYADAKDLELEKRLMTRHYKVLFDKWATCAKYRPGEDPNECQKDAEKDISSARFHFQALQTLFDAKKSNGKQEYDPNFNFRYVATWQWMKKYEGKGYFTAPSYDQVKKLEIGLIPFRDYATLHLIALEAFANSYKDKDGAQACKIYKHNLGLIIEKSDYYVRYVKWAYEWIYIRQYEENMYFGVPGRSGGGPASASRGGFLGTRKCTGSKCTIECSQMMKDNVCTVQKRRWRKRDWQRMRKASDLCDTHMGKLKQALVKFWTKTVLDVAKRWEKYGDDAKKKLAAAKC